MLVIPTLRKLGYKDHFFKTSVGYIVRPCIEEKERNQEGIKREEGRRERELSWPVVQREGDILACSVYL